MSTTYPFDRDEDWQTWGIAFAEDVAANAATYGVSDAVADGVSNAATSFAVKMQIARAPATRGKANTQAKNDALLALKAAVKPVVSMLQLNGSISNATRTQLGLKIVDNSRTAAKLPAMPPAVELAPTGFMSGYAIVRDPANPDRRGKPKGCKSILVRATTTAEGAIPTQDVSLWPVKQVEQSTNFNLVWPELRQTTIVWIACSWVTTRGEEGLPSTPVSTRLAGTGQAVQASQSGGDGTMKIAA